MQGQLALLAYYASHKTELEKLKMQAEALHAQLGEGNQSAAGNGGDALAVFLARAQAFNIKTPPSLQLSVTDINALQSNPAGYASDMETIIQQIEAEIEKTDNEMQSLSETLAAGGDYQYYDSLEAENPLYQAGLDSLNQITNLELASIPEESLNGTPLAQQIEQVSTEIQSLQAQLEQEQATQRQLTSERDLAEKAYQALRVKETEIRTGAQTSNEVVLASKAVPPLVPDSRGTLTNTLLAGMVGGTLAVVWVFASEWWESRTEEETISAA